MRKLKFKIYIGANIVIGQGKNIVAVLVLAPELPKGHYKIDGTDNNECGIGFIYLSDLANYINDWIDLVENENLIQAEIYLHKKTQHKLFKGKMIVKAIDAMAEINNYQGTTSFEEIKGVIR